MVYESKKKNIMLGISGIIIVFLIVLCMIFAIKNKNNCSDYQNSSQEENTIQSSPSKQKRGKNTFPSESQNPQPNPPQ